MAFNARRSITCGMERDKQTCVDGCVSFFCTEKGDGNIGEKRAGKR
jgi:hypothetical protein